MIEIAGRLIGQSQKPFVIAEVAQTHEGSLGNAFAFAEIARDAGADAIKFQTHIASEESTPQEPWRIPFSRQDSSRYNYWQRMEFSFDQWRALKEHCDKLGIVFLSSPFSIRACDWLDELNVPAWKIASGEIHNRQLLERVARTKRPILISTGLARPDEVAEVVRDIAAGGSPVAVFHCTTRYPTPPEEIGLNVMLDYMASLPGIALGLSDHSGTPYAAIVAAYLGASLIEVHLTMHRKMFGPDVSSSLTPDELSTLVDGVHSAWRMRHSNVDKNSQIDALASERSMFGRSLFTSRPLTSGSTITEADIAYRKPGGGILYQNRGSVLGRKLRRNVPINHMISEDDVE